MIRDLLAGVLVGVISCLFLLHHLRFFNYVKLASLFRNLSSKQRDLLSDHRHRLSSLLILLKGNSEQPNEASYIAQSANLTSPSPPEEHNSKSFSRAISGEDEVKAAVIPQLERPGRFQPVVDRIISEAERDFNIWDKSLTNWKVYNRTDEHVLYTTNDVSNGNLLTLKLIAVAKNPKGDFLGAFEYMLTSGDMEKHDSYITDTHVYSSKDNSIVIEHKHLRNPFPLVWARSLLSVRYDKRTETSFCRHFCSCDDLLDYPIPSKTISAFNRGRHLIVKEGDDYRYTFVMQVNPRGRLSMIPMLLKFMAGYAGEEFCKAYHMVLASDLEEPGLVSFKEHLRTRGLAKPKKKRR